jgi:hypothetical protein
MCCEIWASKFQSQLDYLQTGASNESPGVAKLEQRFALFSPRWQPWTISDFGQFPAPPLSLPSMLLRGLAAQLTSITEIVSGDANGATKLLGVLPDEADGGMVITSALTASQLPCWLPAAVDLF